MYFCVEPEGVEGGCGELVASGVVSKIGATKYCPSPLYGKMVYYQVPGYLVLGKLQVPGIIL